VKSAVFLSDIQFSGCFFLRNSVLKSAILSQIHVDLPLNYEFVRLVPISGRMRGPHHRFFFLPGEKKHGFFARFSKPVIFVTKTPYKPVVKRNHSFFPATARLANDATGARKLQDLTTFPSLSIVFPVQGGRRARGTFLSLFLRWGGIKSESKRLSLLRTRVVVSKHEKARVKALSLNLRGCLDTHESNNKSSQRMLAGFFRLLLPLFSCVLRF